jgi:hypothetical protein
MGLPTQPKTTLPRSLRSCFHSSLPWSLITVGLIVLCLHPPTLPNFLDSSTSPSPTAPKLSQFQLDSFRVALQKCRDFQISPLQYPSPVPETRSNPRWNPSNGQNEAILLRNATLFDGESILNEPVDIVFSNSIIKRGFSTSESIPKLPGVKILQLNGRFVTPGSLTCIPIAWRIRIKKKNYVTLFEKIHRINATDIKKSCTIIENRETSLRTSSRGTSSPRDEARESIRCVNHSV